jgi:alpha-methylacyl-CoA racemase
MIARGDWRPEREANLLDGGAPFYRTYQTSEGGFVAVGALEPRFYASLLQCLGVDPGELPDQYDRAGWPVIKDRLASLFGARTRAHWELLFAGTDACVTPVLTMSESPRDPHLVDRASFVAPRGVVQPAPAPRVSRTPPSPPGRPPLVGADSRAILDQLGYGSDHIGMLIGLLAVGAPITED